MCSLLSSLVLGPLSTVVRAAGPSASQAGVRMCWELEFRSVPSSACSDRALDVFPEPLLAVNIPSPGALLPCPSVRERVCTLSRAARGSQPGDTGSMAGVTAKLNNIEPLKALDE